MTSAASGARETTARRECARASRSRPGRYGRTATTGSRPCSPRTALPRPARPGSRPARRSATTRSRPPEDQARRTALLIAAATSGLTARVICAQRSGPPDRAWLMRHRPGGMVRRSRMTDSPWPGDACSLVDAFRAGERSPVEELEATLGAIAASDLNAFSFLDADRADRRGTPARTSSAAVRWCARGSEGARAGRGLAGDRRHRSCSATGSRPSTSPVIRRLVPRPAGPSPWASRPRASSAASTSGVTKLNGVTHNPWRHGRTPGGSSAGSAAAVAGGLVTLATGGDGGGSIRIPAGYTGPVRHEGHVRPDPARARRVVPSRDRRARLSCPLRSRRRRATTTCAAATTRSIRRVSRSVRVGRPSSARTTSRAGGSR